MRRELAASLFLNRRQSRYNNALPWALAFRRAFRSLTISARLILVETLGSIHGSTRYERRRIWISRDGCGFEKLTFEPLAFAAHRPHPPAPVIIIFCIFRAEPIKQPTHNIRWLVNRWVEGWWIYRVIYCYVNVN